MFKKTGEIKYIKGKFCKCGGKINKETNRCMNCQKLQKD